MVTSEQTIYLTKSGKINFSLWILKMLIPTLYVVRYVRPQKNRAKNAMHLDLIGVILKPCGMEGAARPYMALQGKARRSKTVHGAARPRMAQ